MAKSQEKFKTAIGGQALIEGIMMRGPEKDAIVVRKGDELDIQVTQRNIPKRGSLKTWPLIRGVVNFFDSQVCGVKALMHSADLSPEAEDSQEEMSKFDLWLEKKLGDERFQKYLIGSAVALGLAMSIGLFFLLPMLVSSLLSCWISSNIVLHLLEGVVRIVLFLGYLTLASRMKEMKRVFAYHGAEHKTIHCYESGLDLTVENCRQFPTLHPRCGTSFLMFVFIIAFLLHFVLGWPNLWFRIISRLLLLPVIAGLSYSTFLFFIAFLSVHHKISVLWCFGRVFHSCTRTF